MIKFQCENCGKKFKIDEKFAGKKGKCPQCKNVIKIPKLQTEKDNLFLEFLETPIETESKKETTPTDSNQIRLNQHNQPIIEHQDDEEEEKTNLPWPIDALLYPTSLAGIINLIVFMIPHFLMLLLSGLFLMSLTIPFIIFAMFLYFNWYIAECIRDSSSGKTRAPALDTYMSSFGDVIFTNLKILSCYVICYAPALIYFGFHKNHDPIFWALIAYGMFFFPISFLAVVLYDSVTALNPFFLINSIIKTFFSYCLFLAVFASLFIIPYLLKPSHS